MTLLSRDEHQRHKRFYRAEHRQQFLIAHALLRTSLSRYVDVAPRDWLFNAHADGRPEISDPSGTPPLRFNLSHTPGLCACVVTRSADCGVDVEKLRRVAKPLHVAGRVFSDLELADLKARNEGDQHRRFSQCWTLKEAYLKARGTGFTVETQNFSMRVDDATPARILFTAPTNDRAADWQLALFEPTPSHILALALRREGLADCAIKFFELKV